MIVQTVASIAELARLEPEWRQLETRLTGLPFVTFDWAYTWWTRLNAQGIGARDELFVKVFRGPQGELRGVAPLMLTRWPGLGPTLMRQLQFFGADLNMTEVRTVAAAPEDTAEVLNALFDHLKEFASGWDFMRLTGVPTDLTHRMNLSDFGDARWVNEASNYYLTLEPTWEAFKAKLPRNIRESLRKCYNAPKRDGVNLQFEVVRERSQVRGAVEDFLKLHDARAKLEGTVRHTNVFSGTASQQFLVEVCQQFAARDCLRIFRIKVGDTVAATRIGFCCDKSLYLYYSGYDPQFAKYSVMTTTVAEAIQFAIREGFTTVNLSTGNDVSKLRWRPTEAAYQGGFLVSPTLRGTLTHRAYGLLRQGLMTAASDNRLPPLVARRV